MEKEERPATNLSMVVAIAASGNRNSKLALKWALDNFSSDQRKVVFRILHVRPKITMVPSPMGPLPIASVREDLASAYIDEMERKTNEMLAPYQKLCAQKKVKSETLVIEAEDVVAAVSAEVAKSEISKLVLGSSARNILSRRFTETNTSPKVGLGWNPHFYVVYFVSRGKLSSVHTASLDTDKVADTANRAIFPRNSFSSYASATQTGWSDAGLSGQQLQLSSPCSANYGNKVSPTGSQLNISEITNSAYATHLRTPRGVNDGEVFVSVSSGYAEKHGGSTGASDSRSFGTDNHSGASAQTTSSGRHVDSTLSIVQITDELERLKIELRHVQETFRIAQDEKADAARKIAELSSLKMKEANRFKLVSTKEEEARELAKYEKEKRETAESEAKFAKECLDREINQRKAAEVIAAHEEREKQKLENMLVYLDQQFEKFEWDEIVSATSSFSDSLCIGEGAYGSVYKCTLRHTTVAVKALKLIEAKKDRQFQRELEILSRIRHPHLLLLVGACPDHGCLVYEYMENGSLEDRLRRMNGTPPISWFDRIRIAWEVASALLFLHNSKPRPVVHRDLKPANILLDRNFVSKIGDVGLCTLIPMDHETMATVYKKTALVGTYCYVDPEYQRTGLVSPKSDVYALGIVILQLLTGQPPMGLAHFVENAMEDNLEEILDNTAGNWPIKEAKELADLGLRCAELQHKDRPNLKDVVLPVLARLKEAANRAKRSISNVNAPPSHFLCPILQDIMEDPLVAPDGYTYERKAIERWLSTRDTSPMTNLSLPNKNLIPNRTLSAAISEWKSKNL